MMYQTNAVGMGGAGGMAMRGMGNQGSVMGGMGGYGGSMAMGGMGHQGAAMAGMGGAGGVVAGRGLHGGGFAAGGAAGGAGVVAGQRGGPVVDGGAAACAGCVACGNPGCAGACGGAEVICCEPEGAVQTVQWRYVGQGFGSFAQVASYDYVGEGYGSYVQEVVWQKYGWKIRPCCLCLLLLALLIPLLMIIMPNSTSSTTGPTAVNPFDCTDLGPDASPEKIEYCCDELEPKPDICFPVPTPLPSVPKTCLVWGDPHIQTFDGGHDDFYGEGVYWLVKSAQVFIQGKYKATPFTHGLAATDAIAIGGPFLQGHKLEVGAMETGQILWDGVPVCGAFPSSFNLAGIGHVEYNGEGQLVDNAMNHLERHIVHISLPLGVHVQVMRWSHHVNVRITMSAQPGQDGDCGNFNGNVADDSSTAIRARIGPVSPGASLFQSYVPPTHPRHPSLEECQGGLRTAAETKCKQMRPGISGAALEACVFDTCIAGPQYAAEDTVY